MVWSEVNGHRSPVSAAITWIGSARARSSKMSEPGRRNFNLSVSATGSRPGQNQFTVSQYAGIRFFLGRDFLPEEGELGKEHVWS